MRHVGTFVCDLLSVQIIFCSEFTRAALSTVFSSGGDLTRVGSVGRSVGPPIGLLPAHFEAAFDPWECLGCLSRSLVYRSAALYWSAPASNQSNPDCNAVMHCKLAKTRQR